LSADLSAIDARTYPKLQLVSTLQSSFGTATPILKSWSVEYEGPPDPATAPQLVRVDRDSVLEGEDAEFSADIYNIGYTTADSLKVNFSLLDKTNAQKLFQSVQVNDLGSEDSKTVSATLNSSGLRGLQTLVVELDSKPNVELYNINNVVSRTFYIRRDSTPPQLQITFDGVQIVNGDYVSANPTILMKLFDNSPLPLQDTSNVSLRLDNASIPYLNNPQLTYSFPPTGSEKAELRYQPQLTDGGHTLFIDAQDASGNPLSGSGFGVDFTVQSASTLQGVYNYPNPFSNDTYFTFNLTGSTLPDELKIRIYTVAGRLIHTLLVPPNSLRFGFNRFHWDGRDYDGNEIANGVYFYTMVLKSGDKTFNVTERLAKVR
jgi:flagellar hook assembly protein FlgD